VSVPLGMETASDQSMMLLLLALVVASNVAAGGWLHAPELAPSTGSEELVLVAAWTHQPVCVAAYLDDGFAALDAHLREDHPV
jgi:hypothetical protein